MALPLRFDALDRETARRPWLGRLERRGSGTLVRWRHGFLAGAGWLSRRESLSRGLLVRGRGRARNVLHDTPALAIWALKDLATLHWYNGDCEQDEQRQQSHSSGEKPGITSHVHQRKRPYARGVIWRDVTLCTRRCPADTCTAPLSLCV